LKPIRRAEVSHSMPRYVLFLVSREWFEGFKENIGRVDVVQGVKARKARPPLRPGDIMVLVAKGRGEPRRSWGVVGELEVVELKKVGKDEYEELKRAGRVYEPPVPDFSRGFIFIKVIKVFQIYPREVKLSELCDVKTRKSKEPICRWILTGATVIDEQAIQGIREKAQPTPIPSHSDLVKMVVEIGRTLGFHATSEEETPDKAYRLDVVWRDAPEHAPLKVFEVEVSGDVDRALVRLMHAHHNWHPELYLVVADERKREKAVALVRPRLRGSFTSIADKLTVVGADDVIELHKSISRHKELIEKLSKR
jgi:hypothetical protein